MTDVKFMDLSQNDNPATTDSVLIGNSKDGLKRTTIGAIGNLFSVNGLFHFEKVTAQNDPTAASSNFVSLAAPDVPGYTFAFWLAPLMLDGSTVPVHIEDCTSKTSGVFLLIQASDTTVQKFRVSAVYVNSKVA